MTMIKEKTRILPQKRCAVCEQPLENWGQYHTYEMCLLYRLNSYRKYLGKSPIQVDIEAEDRYLKMATGKEVKQ